MPVRVGLQAHRELVEVLRHLVVVVEALVEVGLAVAVEVVQPHDLVAAADVDRPVAELQPERLEQPGGDPLPGQPGFRVVEPADQPHVAVPGADGHPLAVGEEVEPGQPQLGVPRVAARAGRTCPRRTGRRSCRASTVVFSTSGQRFGPPSVSGFSGRGAGEVFANAASASASPFAISTFTRVGVARGGNRQEREPVLLRQ